MKYMGSKSRIAKQIIPIIQDEIDKTGRDYLEPFVGGCNVIDKIQANEKYGNDNNEYLIALWQYLQNGGELPQDISKDEYVAVRDNPSEYETWYVGAVGFLASYNGKFNAGYAGKVKTKIGTVRDYYDESKRNILNQVSSVKDVTYSCEDYRELTPENLVIYCDPPYKNTTSYTTSQGFDHDEFWNTMREWSKNNTVFISEETAPDDFECVWQQEVTRTQDNNSRSKATEKLFKLKDSVCNE